MGYPGSTLICGRNSMAATGASKFAIPVPSKIERNTMPYTKSPRPYKHEYQMQKSRSEHADRMERQRARRAVDKTGKDANGNGKADRREGKDVSHRKMLSKGGTNKDGYYIESSGKNRSRNGHSPKKNKK